MNLAGKGVTTPERPEGEQVGRDREVGEAEGAGHRREPQHDRHRLLGADHGDRDDRHAGPHGDLDEAAAPEAAELVAVGERLRRSLGALGEDQRQLPLVLQEPVGVGGTGGHPAGAGPQGPDDGHGPEEVVGQAVDGPARAPSRSRA